MKRIIDKGWRGKEKGEWNSLNMKEGIKKVVVLPAVGEAYILTLSRLTSRNFDRYGFSEEEVLMSTSEREGDVEE